jgi:hypothetical protein
VTAGTLALGCDIVSATARAAARRELRVVSAALGQGMPLLSIWFEVYLEHHLFLRQFLGLSHPAALAYVSARFARLIANVDVPDSEFLAAAEADLRPLIESNV